MPDWIALISSPSIAQRDPLVKVPLHAAHGVPHLWLIEPVDARIEADELTNARWSWLGTCADDREARIAPFDAVPLDLVAIWEWTGLRG